MAVLFYCSPGAGRSAPNTGVISATFGVAQVLALVGLPRAFVPKEVERRSLVLERGLVTTCLSKSERRRLPDKRKQQGWVPRQGRDRIGRFRGERVNTNIRPGLFKHHLTVGSYEGSY